MPMNTNQCRICKKSHFESIDKGPLFQYAIRHSCHAECGLTKWGVAFLDKLHPWQLKTLPFRIVDQFNLKPELEKRLK